jgi:hypothetical protein
MMHRRSLMLAAGGLDIADAFSTDLYTGNSTARAITNGVDLSGEGGLVWTKSRDLSYDHNLNDTERGTSAGRLVTNSTAAQIGFTYGISSFNNDGYSLTPDNPYNATGYTYVAWTFRKTPKFFDVVTYTGDGVHGRNVAHNLGITPGIVIVKNLSTAKDWAVGVVGNHIMTLNSAAASPQYTDGYIYPNNNTDETFQLVSNSGLDGKVNDVGDTYVAYLFAHDTDASSVIQCGSYTGNGSATGPVVTLGWEPQWLLIKRSDGSGSWYLQDNVRNTSNPRNSVLFPNASAAEQTYSSYDVDFTSTGFQILSSNVNAGYNASGGTYIYMAIRKEGA